MNKRGFTLIEILVTMTILAMIASLIGGAFKMGISSWEKGEERSDQLQRIRVIFDSMIQDIRSYYYYKFSEPPEGSHSPGPAFRGFENRFTFVTSASGFNMGGVINSGLRAVSYYIAEDQETGEKSLFLRESPVITRDFFVADQEEEGTVTKLYSNVEELRLTYSILIRDAGTGDRELTQVDEWNPMDSMDTEEANRQELQAVNIAMNILDKVDSNKDEKKYRQIFMTVVVGKEEMKRIGS